jgi:hypothetical protein
MATLNGGAGRLLLPTPKNPEVDFNGAKTYERPYPSTTDRATVVVATSPRSSFAAVL